MWGWVLRGGFEAWVWAWVWVWAPKKAGDDAPCCATFTWCRLQDSLPTEAITLVYLNLSMPLTQSLT